MTDQGKSWVVVVDPLEDDGELVEEIYANLPHSQWSIRRDTIRIVLETLVRLEYEISYYPDDVDT